MRQDLREAMGEAGKCTKSSASFGKEKGQLIF